MKLFGIIVLSILFTFLFNAIILVPSFFHHISKTSTKKFLETTYNNDKESGFIDSETIILLDIDTTNPTKWSDKQINLFTMEFLIKLQDQATNFNDSYLLNLHSLWFSLAPVIIKTLEQKNVDFDIAYQIYIDPFYNSYTIYKVSSNIFLAYTKTYEKTYCHTICNWPNNILVVLYEMIMLEWKDYNINCNTNNIFNKLIGLQNKFMPSHLFNNITHNEIINFICIEN
jgi:hypothetical protein